MYNTKYRNNNKGEQPGSFRKYKSLRANAYQANSSSSNFRRLMNNDSSNSSSKSVEVPGTVPILQFQANADSNLSKWIEALQPILESFVRTSGFIYCNKQVLCPNHPGGSSCSMDKNDRPREYTAYYRKGKCNRVRKRAIQARSG